MNIQTNPPLNEAHNKHLFCSRFMSLAFHRDDTLLEPVTAIQPDFVTQPTDIKLLHASGKMHECFLQTAARLSSWNHPQKASPPLMGATQHLTGNNIPCCCSHALIPVNLVSTVSPLKPNAVTTVCRMANEIQSRKTQKAPPALFQETLRMENLSATIVLAATDKLLFHKCQWAFCHANTARDGPVTSPGEHLPAPALRSAGADLGFAPLANSFHSQFVTFDCMWHHIDV